MADNEIAAAPAGQPVTPAAETATPQTAEPQTQDFRSGIHDAEKEAGADIFINEDIRPGSVLQIRGTESRSDSDLPVP